ncbi:MAG: hypothetical protein GX587_05835 [Bacteroidales bacterium]|nr:hypothetical protein [Bacteroidales bacterium]
MKRIITFLTIVIASLGILNAQAPESFNYQAVIRDANGEIVANQDVAFKFLINKGPAGTETVYAETQSATTDDFGLVNLKIGEGNHIIGYFNDIKWGENEYILAVEIDITGGTNHTPMGSTKLISVPYALHANTAKSLESRSIPMSIFSAFLPDGAATFTSGYGVNSGISLSDAVISKVNMNFTLPQDYIPGSEIHIRYVVSANATGIVGFFPNFISVSRAGVGFIQGTGATTGFVIESPVSITEANKPYEVWGTIVCPDSNEELQPGDGIIFGVYRNITDANTGVFKIHAVEIFY